MLKATVTRTVPGRPDMDDTVQGTALTVQFSPEDNRRLTLLLSDEDFRKVQPLMGACTHKGAYVHGPSVDVTDLLTREDFTVRASGCCGLAIGNP